MRLTTKILLLFVFFFNCTKKEDKKSRFHLFYTLEVKSEKAPLNTTKKRKVPFIFNNTVDPFCSKHSKAGINKSTFIPKTGGIPKVYFLKHYPVTINSTMRGGKKRESKGLPIIIENKHPTDTLYIKLFQGKVITIQEALSKKKEWKPIERKGSAKMGYYYYQIFPKEYIYTKIPVYTGEYNTKIRTKVLINDSITITTGTYKGSINLAQFK